MKRARKAGIAATLATSIALLAGCTASINWFRGIEKPTPNTYWTGYTYPSLGLGVSLSHSEKPRYERFRKRHSIDRLEALEYLALNPEACKPRNICSYVPPQRGQIKEVFQAYHHAEPKPKGVRWRVRDRKKVPEEFFNSSSLPSAFAPIRTITATIYVRDGSILDATTDDDAVTQTIQEIISQSHRRTQNVRVDTVFVRGRTRTDTVYVQRPSQTDTVYVNRQLPEDLLLIEHRGQQYTFPGASVVCYERPQRECVRIPGRE